MAKNQTTKTTTVLPVKIEFNTPITGDKIKGQVPKNQSPTAPPPKSK
jgi:hypothetical protein